MAIFPTFCDACTMHKLLQLYFKKELTILIIIKYNHKCAKETSLLASKRFSTTKIISIFFLLLLKMKKIDKFGLNYHTRMV